MSTFWSKGCENVGLRPTPWWGLITGLTIYTYLSSRLAIATIALFALYWVAADSDGLRIGWRRHAAGMLLFVFSALVAMMPLLITYAVNPFLLIVLSRFPFSTKSTDLAPGTPV